MDNRKLKEMTDKVSELAFQITVDNTEELINIIEADLKKVESIEKKKSICLHYIKIFKQARYLNPFKNKYENTLNYKSVPEQLIIWCEHELEHLEKLSELSPCVKIKTNDKLTINQIALKYVYSEIQINRKNGNKIAIEYGHNSGEKLFQRFTYYSSAANRKGKPNLCTPRKLNNKIKLLESVVELLPTDKQERAKDEVSILKKIYEAEYQ